MVKTYLISGATSGMGKEVYNHLSQAGHIVVPILRDKAKLLLLPTAPKDYIIANLSDLNELEQSLKEFKKPLDGIIHAAGVLHGHSFQENTINSLQELFNVNVLAPAIIMKHCASLLKQDASVIFFGSISGHKGSYDDAYAASKGAVHSLTRSLALKLAPNARVNCISPGMTENTRMTNDLVEGRFEHNLNLIPMKKAGQCQDIAKLCSYLLSDNSSFMTGSIIDINGGQYLRT